MANGKSFRILSGNMLKIIAAITMLIDHMGVVLFPHAEFLRIIGRISFPIFAYMIAEGCFYTKNKLKYFLSVFILGAGCQLVYSLYGGGKLLGILITFSISIPIIYAMQYMKKTLLTKAPLASQISATLIFILSILACYALNEKLLIDYGFFGCMAPVFASAFKLPREIQEEKNNQEQIPSFLKLLINSEQLLAVFSLGICLVFLIFTMSTLQAYALLALPLLLLYSGKRGKLKMKYFFYAFYPLHLAALEGIAYLLKILK